MLAFREREIAACSARLVPAGRLTTLLRTLVLVALAGVGVPVRSRRSSRTMSTSPESSSSPAWRWTPRATSSSSGATAGTCTLGSRAPRGRAGRRSSSMTACPPRTVRSGTSTARRSQWTRRDGSSSCGSRPESSARPTSVCSTRRGSRSPTTRGRDRLQPSVSMFADGGFVVCEIVIPASVYSQRFDPEGKPIAPAAPVAGVVSRAKNPAVVALGPASFVVVCEETRRREDLAMGGWTTGR